MRFKKHHITLFLAFVAGMVCAPCHGQLFKRWRTSGGTGQVTDVSSTGAVKYNGAWYNGPVCSAPNCAMCNKIRAAQAQARAPKVMQSPHRVVTPKPKPLDIDFTAVTEWVPTPEAAIAEVVPILDLKPTEAIYDLGCGDGRFVIEACRRIGCNGVGIELNPETVERAKARAIATGMQNKVKVINANVLDYSYPTADVVFMYLYPQLMQKVLPRLKKGTRVVSYLHRLPDSREIVTPGGHVFYYLVVK